MSGQNPQKHSKQTLIDLIGAGNTEGALEMLNSVSSQLDGASKKTLGVLSARHSNYLNVEIQGTLSREERLPEINDINKSIIGFINLLPDDLFEEVSSESKENAVTPPAESDTKSAGDIKIKGDKNVTAADDINIKGNLNQDNTETKFAGDVEKVIIQKTENYYYSQSTNSESDQQDEPEKFQSRSSSTENSKITDNQSRKGFGSNLNIEELLKKILLVASTVGILTAVCLGFTDNIELVKSLYLIVVSLTAIGLAILIEKFLKPQPANG